MSLIPCLGAVLALLAIACGNSDDTQPPVGAAGTGGTGTGGLSTDPVGQMLDGPRTCTSERTICATLRVPSDMSPNPALLRFDFYDAPGPPTHPPNGLAGVFPSPDLNAGEELHLELTDGGLTGTYWLLSLVYMPREGQYGIPAIGDFVQATPSQEVHLDGSPINLEQTIEIRLYSAE